MWGGSVLDLVTIFHKPHSLVEPAPQLLRQEELVVEVSVVRHKDDVPVTPPFRLRLAADSRQPQGEVLPDLAKPPGVVGGQNRRRDPRHLCAQRAGRRREQKERRRGSNKEGVTRGTSAMKERPSMPRRCAGRHRRATTMWYWLWARWTSRNHGDGKRGYEGKKHQQRRHKKGARCTHPQQPRTETFAGSRFNAPPHINGNAPHT